MSGTILHGSAADRDLTLSADVVVIGSGAGGATAARVLSERGFSVVVLEEGPHITARAHGAMRPSQSLRHVWRDAGMTAAFGVGDSPLINVTMGRVVGGSSMVTGGVWLHPPEEVTTHWAGTLGLSDLSHRALEPHFAAVEGWVGLEEVPARLRSPAVSRFGTALERAGAKLVPLRRNTRGCQGEARCNFGCPHEAKRSVDLSVLPIALQRGATIVSDALAQRITIHNHRAHGVTGQLGNKHKFTIHAPRVILAGGAWHDPVLLHRSGVRHRDLGRHLTLHPSMRVMARFREPVFGWHGSLQSAYSPSFMQDGLTLVALFVPPGVIAGAMPGFGATHATYTQEHEALQHIGIMGALLHDEGGGRVWPLPGWLDREPVVTYQMAPRDRARLPTALRRVCELYFAAGAEEIITPILGLGPVTADRLRTLDLAAIPAHRYECTSQHPLGTCRMGTDPKTAVTGPDGRVWGIDGLWVADGSLIPTSLGVNPQATVMAFAHQVATGIAG